MENTTAKGLIKWRKKAYYNKITPRFPSNSTNGGKAYFWKNKKDLQELWAGAINLHMYS